MLDFRNITRYTAGENFNKEECQTNENRDLLFDLIKHLRDQNQRQKITFALVIAGLTAVFSAAVILLNAHWLALVAELVAG